MMALSGRHVYITIITIMPFRRLLLPAHPAADEKHAALRAVGALNPHADAVADPAFVGHPFFDPHDLVQVKYEMLRRVHADGHPITQAAAAFGFSRPAFYAAQAALARGGLPALVPQRRGPRRRHKLRPEVLAFLRQARADEPLVPTRELVERVRARFGVVLHPRTIERGLGPRPNPPVLPLPPGA
jgi:transposase